MPFLRRLARALAVSLVAAAFLGMLPPALGGPPTTVVRRVRFDPERLLPAGARTARVGGGAVRLERPAWTVPATACPSIRFTMVGLTWRGGGHAAVPAELWWGDRGSPSSSLRFRSDPDEGPDPGSPDDAGIAGTAPVWTGEAECLRFRLRLPADRRFGDLTAVFVNSSGTADRSPLATVGQALTEAWSSVAGLWGPPAASAMAAKPPIVTRAEWGADEDLRRCGPDYAPKLKMAYVHHTAGSNEYSRDEADDVVRGIYAYHVLGRGFCDIAYHFLIDRFGRIYEGRYGGMTKPVIGGHAMGFNTGSAGVAAMGDFTTHRVPRRVVRAYKRLLAWRLDVAHIKPRSRTTMVSAGGSNTKYEEGEAVRLKVISGHRDTGYTSCPGARLYARLRAIRRGAHRRGRPKIWDPDQSASTVTPGESQVRYTARLSGILHWKVTFTDANGVPVRDLRGRSRVVNATWDGTDETGTLPVPEGTYRVTMTARNARGQARPAGFRVTVESPLP